VALLLCYLLSRWILSSAFGHALMGIRENELRMELLGYNVPLYKTAIFSICAAMAGLAGSFFAMWSEIVTPGLFALGQSAEAIIYVIVGGLGTLIGPMIGAMLIGGLKLLLGEQTLVDNSLVMGGILVLTVLLIPSGIVAQFFAWRQRRASRNISQRQRSSTRRRRGFATGEDPIAPAQTPDAKSQASDAVDSAGRRQ
jgi:ABC-type branched-subunit amino acid transport system permease subunit